MSAGDEDFNGCALWLDHELDKKSEMISADKTTPKPGNLVQLKVSVPSDALESFDAIPPSFHLIQVKRLDPRNKQTAVTVYSCTIFGLSSLFAKTQTHMADDSDDSDVRRPSVKQRTSSI